ncbi:MAG TPA: cytochrome c [Candidatus Binatia bacterium]|jgi:mono/diheme cytochrome c family protein
MKRLCFKGLILFIVLSFHADLNAAQVDAGKEFYLQYCSSCHGQEGHGNGPVSKYISVKIPDLTLIKSRNNGIFPLDKVMSAIDGRREVRGHGTREMPVWGEIFHREQEKAPERTSLIKSKLIAEYLATIQK